VSRARRRLAALLGGGLGFSGYTPRWVAGQVALAGLFALLAVGFVELWLLPAQVYVHFAQLWLLGTAGLLVLWLGRPLREPPSAPAEPAADAAQAELRDRPYAQVERWERRLSVTAGDPEWFSRVVRDRLTGLVAERLWQRHGIRLATDPDRARAVLGDELSELLTSPLAGTPDPGAMSRLIDRMEEI
jgi:hypothetical protein